MVNKSDKPETDEMTTTPNGSKKTESKPSLADAIREIDAKIEEAISTFNKDRVSPIYPLFLGDATIIPSVVDDVFDDLCTKFPAGNEHLDIRPYRK